MTEEAKITAVPMHEWVIRAVHGVSADEANTVAEGGAVRRVLGHPVRFEGPNCLHCGVLYERGIADECSARERIESTVTF